MAAQAPKRFYQNVTVTELPGGFGIALDDREVKTPARAPLRLPNHRLAEAVAEEWRRQGDKILPETMPLTRLANTAIDRIAPNRKDVIGQVLGFGRSDLICYRAEGPSDLVQRQAEEWDPLLEWARRRHDANLCATQGLAFVEQPESALLALEQAVSEDDNFRLAALHTAASLTGSLVLALALDDGSLDADAAFAAAQLDETYQAEIWGEDDEAKARAAQKRQELQNVARFAQLLRPAA
jgi:chaperone required for assembly of F1-ATPase